jgi:hypothetical protein
MRGDYELSGGILISGSVTLGTPQSAGEKDFTDDGYGFISQSGGLHLNTGGIVMPGFMLSLFQSPYQLPHGAGSYSLSGGILICSNLDASFGGYSQSGGTNYTTSIIFSDPSLTGGALITSNTTITGFVYDLNHPCAPPPFFATQSNGMHYVQNTFHVGQVAIYDLQGGSLSAGNIEIEQNGILNCGNGVISNWGTFALSGTFRAGTQSHYLGKLQTLLSTNSQWCSSTNNNTLDVSGPTGTFIRFRDSRDTSGAFVQVLNWQPWIGTGSSHHIFFGTNAEALTQSELNLLRFVNPAGWPPGNYSARILSTGEIVPPVPPSLIAGKNGNALVLSWPGDYQLVTATNVLGPYSAVAGATSPFTNLFTGQERYFRLALAGP